ncbi:hypothetical protein K9U40_21690 [Xanthobacter autotrophicus]|uniref:hypothetical protein n=1 Tax=Xanthobacter TaxID=279 RepID=UPI0024AA2E5D|nr:hypothetical protein [Xanthobacter autotrophicus]MDI4666913.1 hypothetical protein [Xanthobacter autotrophicus]
MTSNHISSTRASEADDTEEGEAPVQTIADLVAAGKATQVGAAAERARAAEITSIAAIAARMGVNIDAAQAVERGTSPEALRAAVLNTAAERDDATAVSTAAPLPPMEAGPKQPKRNSLKALAEKQAARLRAAR